MRFGYYGIRGQLSHTNLCITAISTIVSATCTHTFKEVQGGIRGRGSYVIHKDACVYTFEPKKYDNYTLFDVLLVMVENHMVFVMTHCTD